MSTGISDYAKDKFLPMGGMDALPATMYLALVTDASILTSYSMGSLTEPTGGYSRMPLITASITDWPSSGAGWKESRLVQWTPSGSNWVGLQHIVLCDGVSGASNIIAFRALSTSPLTVNIGDNLLSVFRMQVV